MGGRLRVDWRVAFIDSLVSVSPSLGLYASAFDMDAGDLNLCPHVCEANNLTTELSLQAIIRDL